MAGDGNSIINLGDIAEPVTVLIKKISNAIGLVYEPRRMKNIARAEIEVAKIKAQGDIQVTEIQQQTFNRLITQEAKKQENVDKIIFQAIDQLPPDADPESLEEDWIAHFFKQCDTVSDEQMQSIWGRLLSGEATKPGSFSRRTINLLSSLDKIDADLFTKVCACVWTISEPNLVVYNIDHDIYKKQEVYFWTLKHLEDIGLLSFDNPNGFSFKSTNQLIRCSYHDSTFVLRLPDGLERLDIGVAFLTQAGRELFHLSGAVRNEAYLQSVLNYWASKSVDIIPVPEKS